ncbi:MAG TPA: hypothetical protein VIL27_03395 [Clostridia bacterium]
MRRIFHGFMFVFLDFNLNLGASSIDLIPDFIGYIMIVQGLDELAEYSPRFVRIRPYAAGMAIYSVIGYVFAVLGLSVGLGPVIHMILTLAETIVSLKICFEILMGIMDMEDFSRQNLNTHSLLYVWKWLAVTTIASGVFAYLTPGLVLLSLLTVMIALVVMIAWLVSFSKTANLYEENMTRIRIKFKENQERPAAT